MAKPTLLASTIFCAVIAAVALVSLPTGFTQAQSNLSQQTLCSRLQTHCNRQLGINDRAERDLRNAGRPMTLAYPGACQARDQVCGASSSSTSSQSSWSSSMTSSSMSSSSYSSSSSSSWMSSVSNYPCGCSNQYAPVCGSDGYSYQNACVAQCYGKSVQHQGLCGSVTSSNSSSSSFSSSSQGGYNCNTCGNQQFSPVCGTNNQTYANGCYAHCYGQNVKHQGSCSTAVSSSSSSSTQGGSTYPCGCPTQQNPVCGNDNRSYANTCVAQCYGQSVKHQGICNY